MASENRLPVNNFYGGWDRAGNWDSTSNAHAAGQPYAWDIDYAHSSDPTGTSYGKIYAARAGYVVRAINDVPGTDPQPASFTPAWQATPAAPNGYGGSGRGGNQVVIRHADGTATAYCHMRTGTVTVSEGQYVNRGKLLGSVGSTGGSTGPHTHFERVAWSTPPPYTTSPVAPNVARNLDNNQGSSIITHFEGWNGRILTTPHAEPWRLNGNEDVPFTTIVDAQDGWRGCYKCGSLFYEAVWWGSGVCKAGGAHAEANWVNYTLFCDTSSPGQADWKWCIKCSMLFYSINGSTRCPVTSPNSNHDGSSSQNYRLANGPSAPGEHGWRWCSKCQSLWSVNAGTTVCNAGGSHSQGTSTMDFALSASLDDIQKGWKNCSKCRGVFITASGGNGGVCPSGGVHTGLNDYVMFHSVSPINASGGGQNSTWQEDWAWCGKCAVLFFRPWESSSKCPVGPTYRHTGAYSSTNYIVPYQVVPSGVGQNGWRWCSKCQGLVGTTVGDCPAGGSHNGLGDYALTRDTVHT